MYVSAGGPSTKGALDSQIPLFEGVLVYDANLAKIIDSKALYDISFTRIDITGDRSSLSRVDCFVRDWVTLTGSASKLLWVTPFLIKHS